MCFVVCVEKWCGVGVRGVLDFRAVIGLVPHMGGIFGACRLRVLEPLEGPLDISRHGYRDVAIDVIPREG